MLCAPAARLHSPPSPIAFRSRMNGPDFSLKGRVALITGSGRGIGLGMARALAAHGCAVAIQDIDLEVARAEAENLVRQGAAALALGGDIADPSLPRQLIDRTIAQFGGLDILINNAAIQSAKSWLECTPGEIEREWRANMLAPIMLCQLATPVFIARKWGRIINLGSIQQKGGNPNMMPYAMSKAGLENMTRALARDLAKHGITVNMIAPGYFNTWRNRHEFQKPEDFERAGRWIPAGRVGEPQDAGGLAVFLCSDASAYITGQTIFLDGGLSVR